MCLFVSEREREMLHTLSHAFHTSCSSLNFEQVMDINSVNHQRDYYSPLSQRKKVKKKKQ